MELATEGAVASFRAEQLVDWRTQAARVRKRYVPTPLVTTSMHGISGGIAEALYALPQMYR